jgi:hypothetical protein
VPDTHSRTRQSIQESVLTRAFLGLGAAVIVELLLHHFKIGLDWERLWTLLTILIGFSLSILLEQLIVPKSFKKLRRDMVGAAEAARENDLLDTVLNNMIGDLDQRLFNLRNFKYIDTEGVIPQLSIDTIQQVKQSAFATFVADAREHIYEDAGGRSYMNAWYQKAAELSKKGALHRLFITNKLGDLTEEAFRLIEENYQRGVKVSVIERRQAEDLRLGCELDFGLFDESCLMTVKPLSPEENQLSIFFRGPGILNQQELAKYQTFRDRLIAAATPGKDFLREFGKPINATFWTTKMTYSQNVRLGPPHGLSTDDAQRMLDLIVKNTPNKEPLRIAILGLTPQLREVCEKETRVGEFVLIDQTVVFQPLPGPNDKWKLETKTSWLDFETKNAFDGVLGDEALNNLSLKQYPRFFRTMQKCLKTNGLLVLRTMARYDPNAENFLPLPETSLLERIKNEPFGETEAERGARIIEYLHSTHIAFDDATSMISTQRYNLLLNQWLDEGKITPAQAANYWFPDRTNPDLKLSSPTWEKLREHCNRNPNSQEPYFESMSYMEVDATYCGSDGLLSSFYRITPFVLREAGEE